jgi:hypothetical protein
MEGSIMDETLIIKARGFGVSYYKHKIFELLLDLESFYEFLSDNSSNYCNGMIVTEKYSIDSSIYSSIAGSMESIRILVYTGRLNDAFTLSRKYYDAVTTDIYKSILIKKDELAFFDNDVNLSDLWNNSHVHAWTYAKKHLYDSPSRKTKSNSKAKTGEDVSYAIKMIDEKLYKIIDVIKGKKRKFAMIMFIIIHGIILF